MLSADLRLEFLNFFKTYPQISHTVVPSAPLVPHNDPSLLFTSAGMVPFKDMFTGKEKPIDSALVSCQKCVRSGGKHNDLEQVGYTMRHHTFFEMLGNFSFSKYFKEEAILMAWTFLTKTLNIPAHKLWVTVYHTDEESINIWKKVAHLEEERIIRIATSDNFWSAGDVGPCGPCSEIFYDHGPEIEGGLPGSANADGDRFVEIWNLVFMQFNQMTDGTRINLPTPAIDTGMGLERLAAVMQGVHDNFKTDILSRLVQASEKFSTASHTFSHRVIADHVRSIGFLIADGVMPSAEGRGYVLRRIIRRALRHVHDLQASNNHLERIMPTLMETMGSAYPELLRAEALIHSVLSQESVLFQELLHRGLTLLDEWLSYGGTVLPGEKAFQLYDTYGFPLDLTQDILRAKNIRVDEESFYQQMETQRLRSRQSHPTITFQTQHMPSLPETDFKGYDNLEHSGTILTMIHEQKEIESMTQGQEGYVIVDKSPFYGESGGQVGDKGQILSAEAEGEVLDTQWVGKNLWHKVHIQKGVLQKGEQVSLVVDSKSRQQSAIHHSATHILQSVLRQVLGEHVVQKGSRVSPEKLRFDFSHFSSLSIEDLTQIETQVNDVIRANHLVKTHVMTPEQAMKQGALALFGEKYGENVRVVMMEDASKELCGGTHVQRTGDIGFFKILQESGVASGIRRIEAVAGPRAVQEVQLMQQQTDAMSHYLKASPSQWQSKIQNLLQKKQVAHPQEGAALSSITKETVQGVQFWHVHYNNPDQEIVLKPLVDCIKKQMGSGIVMLSTEEAGKMTIVFGVSHDLCNRYNAQAILKEVWGKGGGRAELAQGGGPSVNVTDIQQKVRDYLMRSIP